MNAAIDTVAVAPEPSRLLEGLRDTGYNFSTAIADIVDNSIAANATQVRIEAYEVMNGIRVSIADDGCGMSKTELINAMKYGAAARDNIHSLGKFGLGLKTASTACCRRLKVISRPYMYGELNCAVWDLDYIAQEQDWLLRIETPTEDDCEELEACAEGGSGTLVVWENCDRLLPSRYTNPGSKAAHAAFQRSLISLRQHIAMVYQRFLDVNDDRAQNVTIILNGDPVEPWDPFCTEIDRHVGAKDFRISTTENGVETVHGVVKVKAYIVPAKQELDGVEAQARVMPSVKNPDLKEYSEESLSGFYIYRENRLIHWGEWFGIPGVDFHHKLCRYELSFDAELDELFQIDIKKSRIILNDDLKQKLIEFAAPYKNEGNNRFRQNEKTTVKVQAKGLHAKANAMLSAKGPNLTTAQFTENEQGTVTVTNKYGVMEAPYDAIEPTDNEMPIRTVDSIVDGLLWKPALIGANPGVLLNANHEFYQRFYIANKDNQNAITAMDSVFWAFGVSESEVIDTKAAENLEDQRYQVSAKLRKLARELPQVSSDELVDTTNN